MITEQGIAHCNHCKQPVIAEIFEKFAIAGLCPSCWSARSRQQKREQRTPNQRAEALRLVFNRVRVDPLTHQYRLDVNGNKLVHYEDIEELLAEIDRLRKIATAAQAFIEASSDDVGPYTEEQRAYDALVEALVQETKR